MVQSNYFEISVMFAIALNMMTMMSEYYGQSHQMDQTLNILLKSNIIIMVSCIAIHSYTQLCAPIYTPIHSYAQLYTHLYTPMRSYVHSYTQLCAPIYTPIHTHAHLCTLLYTAMRTYIHTYTQLYKIMSDPYMIIFFLTKCLVGKYII